MEFKGISSLDFDVIIFVIKGRNMNELSRCNVKEGKG